MSYLFKKLPTFDLKELNGKTLKISVNENINSGVLLIVGTEKETNKHYVICEQKPKP